MFEFEKIEKVRKKLGYKSREEFSKSLDIPFATLRSYETAKVENIPHSFFQLLHDKFNVNINYFFDEKEEIFKNTISSIQKINTISGGQVAQTVNGDMVGRDKVDGTAHNKPNTNPQEMNTQQDAGVDVAQNICKDIVDPATLNLFIESYEKAKEKDDIKGLRIYLMDY